MLNSEQTILEKIEGAKQEKIRDLTWKEITRHEAGYTTSYSALIKSEHELINKLHAKKDKTLQEQQHLNLALKRLPLLELKQQLLGKFKEFAELYNQAYVKHQTLTGEIIDDNQHTQVKDFFITILNKALSGITAIPYNFSTFPDKIRKNLDKELYAFIAKDLNDLLGKFLTEKNISKHSKWIESKLAKDADKDDEVTLNPVFRVRSPKIPLPTQSAIFSHHDNTVETPSSHHQGKTAEARTPFFYHEAPTGTAQKQDDEFKKLTRTLSVPNKLACKK